MLATIVYAVNPNDALPVEGFTAFSPSPQNAIKRKADLESQIATGSYKRWSGEWRRNFIDRCNNNGWEIVVKNVMIG